jgi:NADPH-dependent 2,4-dienoyl-CoA reductase/sulfur reductase-like enzyme/peroxiredoxin family protein/rhodanese-related sulfurtransferase/TusA-related sulfurtransferase
MKYLIVGGVAGGATTAARLRRNDEKAQIIMFEKGQYISYANCGLPYYIGGTIKDRENLFVQNPQKFNQWFNVDVHIRSEVLSIHRDKKTVSVLDHQTGKTYEESYDKLILSPGADPIRPPLPGIDDPRVFTLRSVPDTDNIKNYINTHRPKRAVIIGAGFIGLEMAENLHQQGIFVTIVEMADQVMNLLDYEMASLIHQHLKSKKVEFYLKDAVTSFQDTSGKLVISLKSGQNISADMVILSIGVRPDNHLAKEAGLAIGSGGGIKVDSFLFTEDPDIAALGDAIEFPHPITGAPGVVPLAGPANKQARILADNLAFGKTRPYTGSIGTAVAKVFDLTVAITGLSEKTLAKLNIKHKAVITHGSSHAGYYPGAMPISMKLVFDPDTGKIFGAQAVGYDGVEKRIDMIAVILGKKGTIYDLTEIEHSYAPPFSSAKDPVNIIGFVAENVIQGKSRHIQWHEIFNKERKNLFILDVRLPEEYQLGHIENAVNIPLHTLRAAINKIPVDKEIVVYCGVGLRAYLAERILRQNGLSNVSNLSGGWKTWESATGKQSNESVYGNDIASGINLDRMGETQTKEIIEVDACGLQCPGPIQKLKTAMDSLTPGQKLRETASDPGFGRDVEAWCRMTGNTLISKTENGGIVTAVIEKAASEQPKVLLSSNSKDATLVVFSDDFDRALASFVIANGAASSGKKVTMFFTFWGLNVIKAKKKKPVKKDFMGKMFGLMLPKWSGKLKLSKLNMAGAGTLMMRGRMKSLKIDSLETMIKSALEAGVRMVACQMSMDVMGVKQGELVEGVQIGGVATYLDAASDAATNLFI